MPYGLPQMLAACEFDWAPQREIVVVGKSPGLLWKNFDPNRILLHASPEMARYQPATAAMTGTGVYVCENFTCHAPAVTEQELAAVLGD
jgi:uncharacterized protein YyaL (SSP411 family)